VRSVDCGTLFAIVRRRQILTPGESSMSGEPPDASESNRRTEIVPVERRSSDTDDGIATEILRLVLGGTLETTDRVLDLLSPETAAGNDDGALRRARYAAVGLVFEAYGRAARVASTTTRLAGGVIGLCAAALRPITSGRLLAPLLRPVGTRFERSVAMLDRWVRIGRAEERRSRDLARGVAGVPMDAILEHLRDSPEMRELVRRQAEALLAELPDDPRVGDLVRSQGDRYVEHLRENPEGVQELVQGQSVGLVNEVMNSLRQRTVAFDDRLESVVRAMLRRTPRSELPPPPVSVRRRADHPIDLEAT